MNIIHFMLPGLFFSICLTVLNLAAKYSQDCNGKYTISAENMLVKDKNRYNSISFGVDSEFFKMDSTIQPLKHYFIAGSFLIPNNADNQVSKLKKLGFSAAYKNNFPNSEYYSVVVDSFYQLQDSAFIAEKLFQHKIDYFVKCEK